MPFDCFPSIFPFVSTWSSSCPQSFTSIFLPCDLSQFLLPSIFHPSQNLFLSDTTKLFFSSPNCPSHAQCFILPAPVSVILALLLQPCSMGTVLPLPSSCSLLPIRDLDPVCMLKNCLFFPHPQAALPHIY